MSVLGIAIIGKKNEPLYLCDASRFMIGSDRNDAGMATNNNSNNQNDNGNDDFEDNFGFSSMLTEQRHSLPLHQQLILYAGLDCLEDMVHLQNGLMPVLKTSTQHPHWLGLLYEVDDFNGHAVYGYITATNIKFLLLLSGREKTQESSIKDLLADIHQSYIAYVMNPFCNFVACPINSRRFDEKIKAIVSDFEQSRLSKK